MAVAKNCAACTDLQESSPDFMQNGVSKTVYNSLINDTGFNPSSGHNDCTDLNDANDCLVGNMEEEVDAYEVCDWKTFMRKFIYNLWTVLKAIIAAICGLWTRVNRHDCLVNTMFDGARFNVGEDTSGDAYIVAGKGVSFLKAMAAGTNTADVHITYVAGGLFRGGGGIRLFLNDFTDTRSCMNFDNGEEVRTSKSRKGNALFGQTGKPAVGGELLYEIRIKRSAYPQLGTLFSGFGQNANAGAFRVTLNVFDEGKYAYGQHGSCNGDTGEALSGRDAGHLVPAGWVYLQCRLDYQDIAISDDDQQWSPLYMFGGRMSKTGIKC